MALSELLSDYLRELDSEEEWAKTDKFDRELAASLEGFASPTDAVSTAFLQKYAKDHLEDRLDGYYVRKTLKDAPKLAQRTLQLATMAAKVGPNSDVAFYLREATRCYVYAFWAACVALSRAALEQALKETVAAASGAQAARYELSELIAAASKLRLADAAIMSLADRVRASGNRVVHEKASNQGEAWDTLTQVRAVLLALYDGETPAIP